MNISQGEIWEVEFFPNVGSEIGKKRPALVVNSDMVIGSTFIFWKNRNIFTYNPK